MTRPQSPDEPMPPVGGTIRPPETDVSSEQLGSTAQFKAFASDADLPDEAAGAHRSAAAQQHTPERSTADSGPPAAVSAPQAPRSTVGGAGGPVGRTDPKRGLLLALAVAVLVAVVIALLLILL